jgi:Tfp pilus assembly protein PilF
MKHIGWIFPLLLTAVTFFGSLNDSFTNWDDDVYVVNNHLLRNLSFQNIRLIFAPGTFVSGNYQPVTILSLAISYALGGLNPGMFIATNILLHLLNVLLVFLFIRNLVKNDRIACMCAVLFGIHPLHVEPVVWISARKDVLYTCFFLSALLCYQRYRREKSRKAGTAYGLIIAFFILSLLSKSAAVTLPALLLLLDFHERRKFDAKVFLEKIPFLVGAVIIGVLAIEGQQIQGSFEGGAILPMAGRMLISCYSFMFYIVKFVVPVRLSALYPYPPLMHSSLWPLAYKLAPVGIMVAAWSAYYFRRNKLFIFGLLFYSISIIFLVHFVPVGATITADRFSYVPSIGLSLILASGVDFLFAGGYSRNIRKNIAPAAGILIAAILAIAAHERCRAWKDSVTLWKDAVSFHPGAQAYDYLGFAYSERGEYEQAIRCFTNSVAMNTFYDRAFLAESFSHLGVAYDAAGQYDSALQRLGQAIVLEPRSAEIYYNRGLTLKHLRRYEEAAADFSSALDIDPDNEDAVINRGNVYYAEGRYDKAIGDYNRAIAIGGADGFTLYNRGKACIGAGRPLAAAEDFNKACELGCTPACRLLQSAPSGKKQD